MQPANDLIMIEGVPELLRMLEKRMDETLATLADLQAALPRARIEAKLSGVVGQSVLKQMISAGSSMVDARGHVVNVHRLLDGIARQYQIEYAAGDEREKAPMPGTGGFTTGEAAPIGIVA